MKRKIYFNIASLSIIVALLVTIFMLFTFYNFHVENEIKSLRDYGNIMAELLNPLEGIRGNDLNENIDSNIRLTIIDLEGNVLFDNIANPKVMENHLDRIEVKEAMQFGEGKAVRNSYTLDKNTYYYATLLSNNSILRISRQGTTILSHFKKILPFIFVIIFIILFLSLITSYILTNKIINPVENVVINMEKLLENKELEDIIVYEEIMPFINKVKNQEREIKYNIKSLEEKAILMEAITSNMEEGIILLDESKKILSINHSGIKLLQKNSEYTYLGNDFIKLSRNMELHKILNESIDTKTSQEIMLNIDNKYLNVYVNPVLSEDILIGLVILLVDFTKKHKLDLMRREFSANVSHELKTPLTSINGYAEMIENEMVKDEDIKRFASTIRKEGVRLLSLIDSIIKLSKIEEDEYEKDFNKINLYEIGKNVIESLEFIGMENNIKLRLYGENTFINGNRNMIEEMIYNLVDNGIKYTISGGTVDVYIKNEIDIAIIKVIDTGVGISMSQHSRIFERFYTVDKSRSGKAKSTGLGLSIVKHIVEYHYGDILISSEVGKGTDITIKIKNNLL